MKKLISIILSLCMCFSIIGIVPAFAEETAVGGTYTYHATKTGAEYTDTSTSGLYRYYEAQYAWGSTSASPSASTAHPLTYWIGKGNNGKSDYAPFLRFPLPAPAENEVVKSAKLMATVSDVSNMTSELTVHAYAYSPSTKFGSKFSATGFGSFADITAASVGSTAVPSTAKAGDKIEIDVTEHVKSRSGIADFFLAVPNLTATNYVVTDSVYAGTVANRPVLVITTGENTTPTTILTADATDTPVNGYIPEIQFSREMNTQTLTAANITITPGNIPISRVNYSADKTTIKLGLASNLLHNTEYTVSFNGNVKSAGGIAVEEGATFKFTTASSSDAQTLPRLSSSFPEKGAKNVKAINSVTLNFNKELYQPSVTENCFMLNGSEAEVSSVVLHPERKSVFVYFDKALGYNSSYTLSISSLSDLSGNILTDSISFDTAKASVIIKSTEEYSGEVQSNTYTRYTTSDGNAYTDANKAELYRKYEATYSWSDTGALSVAKLNEDVDGSTKRQIWIGNNGTNNYGAVLRFPLPAFSENEAIKSAKLVTTLRTNGLSSNVTMNAYTGFTDISFGESISSLGKTFAEISACNIAGTAQITTSTGQGSKIEIDVTNYIKTLSEDTVSADFALAVPGLPNESNYCRLYSAYVGAEASRPQLIIETIPDTTLVGSTIVTLENVTDKDESVTLIGGLFTSGGIFKDSSIKKDISVPKGQSVQVRTPAFANRAEGDCIRIFGVESVGTLVPLFNSSVGSVDKEFYPGYSRKAVTLSYDDAPDEETITLLSKLNEKGLRTTVNYIPDRSLSTARQAVLDEALISGNHEIASHCNSHGEGNLLPADSTEETLITAKERVSGAKNTLEYKYNRSVPGMAYPGGKPKTYFSEITEYIKGLGGKYARCSTGGSIDIPANFMNWGFTCHHGNLYDEETMLADTFFNLEDDGTLKVLSVWGHAYNYVDSEGNWEDTIFEPFTDTLKAEIDKGNVWQPTNIEFVEYINSLRALVINNDSIYNGGTADVYIKINGVKTVVPAGGTVY